MFKLYLYDPRTEHSVECPITHDGKDGKPIYCWALRDAIRDLVNHIAVKDNVNPLQVMYEQGNEFQIIVADNEAIERINPVDLAAGIPTDPREENG